MLRSTLPIISENGQIIRTISSSKVPASALPNEKKETDPCNYLEVVDTCNKKVRYIPIPQYVDFYILIFLMILRK